MKRKLRDTLLNGLLLAVFLTGVGLLLYPAVSNYVNSLRQARVLTGYANEVAALDDNTYDRLWAEAVSYNQTLIGKEDRFHLTTEELAEYERYLRVSDTGVIGEIEISKLDCRLPIYHGTDETVLQVGVGHLEGSSLPVGGESTHCVISGHRGVPGARLFTDLVRLEVGDTFVLRVLDETLTYEVEQIRIVEPQEIGALDIVEGMDYCTLMTCTPYGVNSHRLLVRGQRTENQEDAAGIRVTADAMQIEPLLVAPIVAVPVLLLLLAGVLLKTRKGKGKSP